MKPVYCTVCDSSQVTILMDTGRIPVFCNQLCRTRSAAVNVSRASVKLGFCEGCGHVYNVDFDEHLVQYGPEYENSLHHSGYFRTFAERLAEELRQRHDLSGKRIVEVGCGSGDFLRELCGTGNNRGFGFDVSYPGDGTELPANVSIQRTAYGPEQRHLDPDLVVARHVLEHVSRPVAFLKELRNNMRTGSAAYVEVPNALFTLRDGGVWDIVYEHCSYFTPSSLTMALELAGFTVERLQEAFDGQFLCANARATTSEGTRNEAAAGPKPGRELRRVVLDFVCAHGLKLTAWRANLAELAVQRRRVVAWGAGSKGNTFANLVAQVDIVPYVVDLNPRKHGMFVAGTGARIVPPEFLVQYKPDDVIVLNPNYEREVRHRLETLGLNPSVLLA